MLARRLLLLLLAFFVLLIMALPVTAQERSYIVQPGDTIQGIAQNFGVSRDALLIRNGIIDASSIRSGDILIIPGDTISMPTQHIVQHGESLTSIAVRYNTTVEALIQENDLAAGVSIFPGQIIKLPAAGGVIQTGTGSTANAGTGGAATFARTHVVDRGETLKKIAEFYGTTWQALAAANNIANPNRIWAGMTLVIPAVGGPVPTPVPTQPPLPPNSGRIYTVQRGDTLSGIAVKLGVTLDSLQRLNNIRNSSQIFTGQVLAVPATGGPVVNPPAPPIVPRRTVKGFYRVQVGDNLFAIAADFRVNIYQIAQANGLLNLNQIYSGQFLRIPGR